MKIDAMKIGLALVALGAVAHGARAENGARLLGFGPVSRAMGGTGIASPQDAIAALTLNPAALPLRPRSDTTEVGFSGTILTAQARPRIEVGGQAFRARDILVAPISTIGLAMPARRELPARVVHGFSIFAAGGLGGDYRDSALDQPTFYDLGGGVRAPLMVGEFSKYVALSVAPAIGVEVVEGVALGLQASLTASTLDVRQGSSTGYGAGALVGVALRPHEMVRLGATYLTAQRTRFRHVADRDGDGRNDAVTIELPEQAAGGVALEPFAEALVAEVDVKWNRWSSAEGFRDLDWRDQWVVATGVQLRPIEWLALRAGYNYGRNPIHRHATFSGTAAIPRGGGATIPGWYDETSRLIGSSGLGQHHLTLGVGVDLAANMTAHLGWVYGFPESIRESGTDLIGQPATIRMQVDRAHTFELGIQLNF